jgi:hypothetical protein
VAYQFVVKPQQSGLDADLTAGIETSGTLIGNYNIDTNPTGTRTKPGLFGSFGETENLPVNTLLSLGVDEVLSTSSAGSFGFSFNEAAGVASFDGFAVDFLSGGSLNVPIGVTIQYDSFRSRSPSSSYPGGFPITLPIGQASLTSFRVMQVGGSAGTITRTGASTLDFAVGVLVQYDLTLSVLGQEFTLPTAPLPFGLSGTITTNGSAAQITTLTPVLFDQTLPLNQTLPQIPLSLPTVLPPGATADVLLDLTLSEVSLGLDGNASTVANGQIVPAPGAWAAVLAGMIASRRRRR